ncbi:LysR substrate binding domain-containing protein [Frondihabitans sp. PhB188]|uniref:LysR family substrate-binding domain-containing protein n=1 Tax=Frondihabitans sp. PhB188 TaxID=2485200 RepID=UPI000FADAE14|nr:LysR family substrate-binding domain-containing protein [Frondihabitans sp. PhB188]ROQ37563.1 LysR substrate binding domain-containing protein [Frondihabitans sp. PhB188]
MELRIAFVPGVTLGKWSRIWEERYPDVPLVLIAATAQELETALTEGQADMAFARLPLRGSGLHAIPLYEELPFVVLPREHVLADDKLVALADLEGETRFDLDPTLDLDQAVGVVATGTGVAVMPQSLARLYGRKGAVNRQVDGLPPTTIALVWPEGDQSDAMGDFIGVVRGRTANSSRDRAPVEEPAPAKPARAPRPAAKPRKFVPRPSRKRRR